MSDLEILEESDEPVSAAKAEAEYEAIIEQDQIEEENLTKLIEAEKLIIAALYENRKRQQDIKDKRFKLKADIRQKERDFNEAKVKEEERLRFQRLEEEKAQAFRDMVEYCKESNFAWVPLAKEHQWEGAMTIAHYGSCVLGDMTGLGKTWTAIMSLDMKKSKKVLIVLPNDVASDFSDTVQILAPHRNLIPIPSATPAMRKMIKTVLATSNEFTVITNYESLWRDYSWLEDVEWDDVIVDEAHSIKNAQGLTFTALVDFTYKNFLGMTATSILNSPEDLFTTLHLIDRMRFHNKYSFLSSYCQQNFDGKWVFRPGGEKALMQSLKGRFIKRTPEECGIEYPKQTVSEILIPMSKVSEKQAKIMHDIDAYSAIMLDNGDAVEIPAMIAVITRLRQAACFPAGIEMKITQKMFDLDPRFPVGHVYFRAPLDTPSIKLDMAEDKLEREVKAGHRSVVFSQFKTALADLEKRLKARGLRVARFDGDTKQNTRIDIKRDFLRSAEGESPDNYKYDVVLVNYKTGGVGLNFTAATYMLCLDEEWNPGKNTQAWARICRIGQTQETRVDILRIEGSFDMMMKTINEMKQAIINGFEAQIDNRLLSTLKEYFAKPAVVATEQKAIEVSTIDIDDDFMAMINGME